MHHTGFAAALLVSVLAGSLSAQGAAPGVLELNGCSSSRQISATDLAAMTRHTVTASAHGVAGEFAGVAIIDLLRLVGAPSSDSLRGKELADYVLVEARDGYRVVFALAEFDAGFTDRVMLRRP